MLFLWIRLPKFEKGRQLVLDGMEQGKFFVTTGEVLIPEFSLDGKGSGETVTLNPQGKATVNLKVDWTFPLNYVEIISGDGENVFREKVELHETQAFGIQQFDLPVKLAGKKWVRVEVWDVAANGGFTQPVWLE